MPLPLLRRGRSDHSPKKENNGRHPNSCFFLSANFAVHRLVFRGRGRTFAEYLERREIMGNRIAKLGQYRPEILTGYTQADVDEAIEEDQ